MEESQVSDWSLPDRGVIKGEALQNFVNKIVGNRLLEKLPRRFAAVATNLKTGEAITFTSGNSGAAVRASSSGRRYVSSSGCGSRRAFSET